MPLKHHMVLKPWGTQMCRTPPVNEAGSAGTLVEFLSTGDRPQVLEKAQARFLLHWPQHFSHGQASERSQRSNSGHVLRQACLPVNMKWLGFKKETVLVSGLCSKTLYLITQHFFHQTVFIKCVRISWNLIFSKFHLYFLARELVRVRIYGIICSWGRGNKSVFAIKILIH